MINMNLQDEFFNYIVNGSKRIELRLYDEKRKKIKIGNKIKLINDSNNDTINVIVIGLYRSISFDKLFNDLDINLLASNQISKENLKKKLEKFYSYELQQKYGVIGIRFELERK